MLWGILRTMYVEWKDQSTPGSSRQVQTTSFFCDAICGAMMQAYSSLAPEGLSSPSPFLFPCVERAQKQVLPAAAVQKR